MDPNYFDAAEASLLQAERALPEMQHDEARCAPNFARWMDRNIHGRFEEIVGEDRLLRAEDAAWLLRTTAAAAARVVAYNELPNSQVKEHLLTAHMAMRLVESARALREERPRWDPCRRWWWRVWGIAWKTIAGAQDYEPDPSGPTVWWDIELRNIKRTIDAQQDLARVVLREHSLWQGLFERVLKVFETVDERCDFRLHCVDLALARAAALYQVPDYVAAKKPLEKVSEALTAAMCGVKITDKDYHDYRCLQFIYDVDDEWWQLWRQAMGEKALEWS